MVKPAENQTENLQVMLVKWDIICQIAGLNVLDFRCENYNQVVSGQLVYIFKQFHTRLHGGAS